jgi:hypothetical protein
MMTASRRRAVLVVSPSDDRRRDWSAVVSDGRTDVAICPGPGGHCVLLRGLETCPLVAASDVVLYDVDAVTPHFLALLLRAHRSAEIVLVRDHVVRGRHRPRVVLRRRPRGTAVGPAL